MNPIRHQQAGICLKMRSNAPKSIQNGRLTVSGRGSSQTALKPLKTLLCAIIAISLFALAATGSGQVQNLPDEQAYLPDEQIERQAAEYAALWEQDPEAAAAAAVVYEPAGE